MSVRVLGVDPGSRKTGWGVVEVIHGARGHAVRHIDNGVLRLREEDALAARLVELSRRLREIVAEYKPDVAAVEDVFVQKGARSALVLGQARGAALAVLGLEGLAVHSHSTSQVKQRVTGRGRASKEQVSEMVRALLGLAHAPFEDAADALAVALCNAYGASSATPGAAETGTVRGRRKAGRDGLLALARAQGKV